VPQVELTTRGPVAEITFHAPPLNILDLAALRALNQVLAQLRQRSDIRVVLLRGAGERAFSAGVAVQDHAPDRIAALLDAVAEQFEHLLALESVTIAAVHGWTLGGGAELALLCDFVLAAEDARVGTPEITLAAFPPVAAVWFPLTIGYRQAAALILGGEPVAARRAAELGLISEVVPPGELIERARTLADRLARQSATAQRAAKRAMRAALAPVARPAFRESLRIYRDELAFTPDAAEGVAAFIDKRTPRWSP